MKNKTLFNINYFNKINTEVYVILPGLDSLTVEVLSKTTELCNKYQKITILCSDFELAFYKFLLSKSKTFKVFQNKINPEIVSNNKIKDIQQKDCIIINLSSNPLNIDTNKKAIICDPSMNSDLIFSNNSDSADENKTVYLDNFLDFLNIKEVNLIKNIDIEQHDVINDSLIACNYINKKYSVIIVKNIYTSFKIITFLKKHKLKKHLALISKHPIGIADPKLLTFKDYNFLDILAFMIQADSIYSPIQHINKNILSNLKINLSFMTLFKEYSALLYDIAEPK